MERVSTTLLGRVWLEPTVSSFVASPRNCRLQPKKERMLVRRAKLDVWEKQTQIRESDIAGVHQARLQHISNTRVFLFPSK